MKTNLIVLFLSFLCLFSACEKDPAPNPESPVVFDPDAKIYVAIAGNSTSNRTQAFGDSTPSDQIRFLFDYGNRMSMTCYLDVDLGLSDKPYYPNKFLAAGADRPDLYYANRDTVNIKFKFWRNEVIDFRNGAEAAPDLGPLPTSEDIVLEALVDSVGNLIHPLNGTYANRRYDTIGYMPNEMMRKGKKDLQDALDRKDYDACYKIFNDFYKFIPITGKEYMELVRQGKN